jgi:hypothetical protein
MAETIDNASDRPVIVDDFTRDTLWREIQQAQSWGLHELYLSSQMLL